MSVEYTNSNLPKDILVRLVGPHPPDDFVSNGCSVSMDRCFAVLLTPACHLHDYHYSLGGGKRERFAADSKLYRNLRRCDLGKLMATIYWMEVRLWGHRHFRWTSEPKPRFLRAFCESFWTRCIGW